MRRGRGLKKVFEYQVEEVVRKMKNKFQDEDLKLFPDASASFFIQRSKKFTI
jgi:hypothetical protein